MGETDDIETKPVQHEVDEPKETDKLVKNGEKRELDLKKDEAEIPLVANDEAQAVTTPVAPKDEIINIPESEGAEGGASAAAKANVTKEGREVKPKKIPIGGIKMPGFFTRSKPKAESDGAEGELLEKPKEDCPEEEGKEKEKEEPKPKRFFRNIKIPYPFAKRQTVEITKPEKDIEEGNKSEESASTKPADGEEEPAASVEAEGEQPQASDEAPQPKRNVLHFIKLPPIGQYIPRRLKLNGRGPSDDVELGNGPNNKAGLASMETLDDSTKDLENGGRDQTDKAVVSPANDDGLETVKLNETNEEKEKLAEEEKLKEHSLWNRIKTYRFSVDDLAIIGGILVFLLLVLIICVFAFSGKDKITSAPVRDGRYVIASTSCGPVEGIREDKAFAFRGIPFAIPPIGEDRWRPAQRIEQMEDCWNGTLLAHSMALPCLQLSANGSIVGEEDCLKLDVVTPHVRYDSPLPVVVLIGADTLTGESPNVLRPSDQYARSRDIVFVRPNFRLGVFGFLTSAQLTNSTHPPTSGNYALSDIIAVLEWVHTNIVHFGGDKDAITVVGHRAGATLVTALLTSPKASNLFARAWLSSGSAVFPGKALEESERDSQNFVKAIKCLNSDCMRQREAKTIIDNVPDTWYRLWSDLPLANETTNNRHEWLALDGEILIEPPLEAWKRLDGKKPKIVIGTTAQEAHSDHLYFKHANWTEERVREHIEKSVIGSKGLTDEALKLYNATYKGLVSIISDIRTVCPLLTLARQQPAVPFYVVTHGFGELGIANVDADIQAILGRINAGPVETRRYMSAIQQLFFNFVSHGDVKQYDPRRRVFDVGQDALSVENYPKCDFWIKNDIVPRYARLD